MLVLALAALIPTVGDFGLTWDEPAYRYSQMMSAQWWEQLAQVRLRQDLAELLDPRALVFFWPYGRHGINFHPPLAGQLNLAAYAAFGHWMKDIPARRMATVIEFALTITICFQFLARRYGAWTGAVAAGSLLLMPRLYGQAHLIDTDTPGLLLWSATAMAFWKGMNEPGARRWRIAVGILLGLAFVEKLGAVVVLVPCLVWLFVAHLPRTIWRKGARFDWIDGIVTIGAVLAPLALAFQQIQILQQRLLPPVRTDFLVDQPTSDWPGAILAVPLVVWLIRRLAGRLFPGSPVWGVERPGLETCTAVLAFAPVIGWLGNPAWWRETLPRLAHYYTLSNQRRGALPDIQIIYFGQVYEFSLPWHNAWVLIGITVPITILGATVIGLVWGIGQFRRDKLPLYFLIHLLTLPVIRMFETPAHDGVRLFLPTFFFLAAFAGWGAVWVADALARLIRVPGGLARLAVAALILGAASIQLVRIHPYELSYYNELIGGPRGAWARGFELTYWYDAFNGPVLAELNRKLPEGAQIDFFNDKTEPTTFQDLQTLGALRPDIRLKTREDDKFPYVWLLTQDSKSSAFTRLLYALHPWFASAPRQLDGAGRHGGRSGGCLAPWSLQALLDAPDRSGPDPPAAPLWVLENAPWLARFWGDGLVKARRLTLNQPILEWSRSDPDGLFAAARYIAANKPLAQNKDAERLKMLMTAEPNSRGARHYRTDQLLRIRPEALVESIQILNAHREEVVKVMTRYGYTDPSTIGGYLDRDLPSPPLGRS